MGATVHDLTRLILAIAICFVVGCSRLSRGSHVINIDVNIMLNSVFFFMLLIKHKGKEFGQARCKRGALQTLSENSGRF